MNDNYENKSGIQGFDEVQKNNGTDINSPADMFSGQLGDMQAQDDSVNAASETQPTQTNYTAAQNEYWNSNSDAAYTQQTQANPNSINTQSQTPTQTSYSSDIAYTQPPQPNEYTNEAQPYKDPTQMSTVYPAYYTGYAAPPPKQNRKTKKAKVKKEKKRYGIGAFITSGFITAIAGGMLAVAVFFYGGLLPGTADTTASTGNQNVTNINVDTTANSTVEAIAQKVSPSVVGIRTTVSVTNQFFGQPQEATGEGSGIIYTSDGYIITNYHVIQDAVEYADYGQAKIEVFLPDDPDTAIEAVIIGYEITSDLAVLKIEKTDLQAIEIGDSDALNVGELAVAIGNPGGLDFMGSVSAGIISGLNRTIQLENAVEMNLIQTDAAINPGNSGGALVNAQGQLVGVNSSKMATESGYEGMGFAIPSNSVVEICDSIIANKDEKKPYVGIEINTQYDSQTLTAMGYPAGVVVQSVVSGGPAEDAGLQQGDIITQFNGTDVSSYDEFSDFKNRCKAGDTVTLTVYRLGNYLDINLTLGESSI